MSPSSLVCCWTWGVRPLFCCVSSSIHHAINLPVRHIHAGCALYRSIVNVVEVEYRRTSIYTQDVKKNQMGVLSYILNVTNVQFMQVQKKSSIISKVEVCLSY